MTRIFGRNPRQQANRFPRFLRPVGADPIHPLLLLHWFWFSAPSVLSAAQKTVIIVQRQATTIMIACYPLLVLLLLVGGSDAFQGPLMPPPFVALGRGGPSAALRMTDGGAETGAKKEVDLAAYCWDMGDGEHCSLENPVGLVSWMQERGDALKESAPEKAKQMKDMASRLTNTLLGKDSKVDSDGIQSLMNDIGILLADEEDAPKFQES